LAQTSAQQKEKEEMKVPNEPYIAEQPNGTFAILVEVTEEIEGGFDTLEEAQAGFDEAVKEFFEE